MKLIKTIVFVIILCVLGNSIFNVLWIKDSTSEFFKEPKNTMDIVYVGASNVYIHFNSTLAFKEYGFTTGILSAGAQTPVAIEYLLKESKKYQNPSLYIIDLTKFVEKLNIYTEGEFRKTFDTMPLSWNRIMAINNSLKYYDLNYNEYINYYFSFFKYHNMWKQIAKQDFVKSEELYKGFLLNSETLQIKSQYLEKWNYEIEQLEEDNNKVLIRLLNYLDESNSNCLFVIPKRLFTLSEMKKMNYITKIIKDKNYNIINFNEINDPKIDTNHDFYNKYHLNVYGSTKYTLYFAKYLKDNYELPDHREDEKYKSWVEDFNRLKEQYKELTNNDFEELVQKDKILLNINN